MAPCSLQIRQSFLEEIGIKTSDPEFMLLIEELILGTKPGTFKLHKYLIFHLRGHEPGFNTKLSLKATCTLGQG